MKSWQRTTQSGIGMGTAPSARDRAARACRMMACGGVLVQAGCGPVPLVASSAGMLQAYCTPLCPFAWTVRMQRRAKAAPHPGSLHTNAAGGRSPVCLRLWKRSSPATAKAAPRTSTLHQYRDARIRRLPRRGADPAATLVQQLRAEQQLTTKLPVAEAMGAFVTPAEYPGRRCCLRKE